MDPQQHTEHPGTDTPAGAGVSAAATEHEHLIQTHFTVIEGWLGLLEDEMLDEAGRRRAAKPAGERLAAVRADCMAFVRSDDASTMPDHPSTTDRWVRKVCSTRAR